jgi:hypothetical protein
MEELMVVMEDAVEHKWHHRKTKVLHIIFLKPVHRIKAKPDYLEARKPYAFRERQKPIENINIRMTILTISW